MLLRAHAAGTAKMNGATAVSSGCSRLPIPCTPSNVPTASMTYGAVGSAWPETSSNSSVRRLEIIEESGPGPAFMAKHHAVGARRCPGQRHALELTSLFDSQFFEGPQFERRRCRIPSSVRRGSVTAEGEFGDWQDSRRAAEIQCENGEVVSCTPRCAVLLQWATGKATILLCALLLAF